MIMPSDDPKLNGAKYFQARNYSDVHMKPSIKSACRYAQKCSDVTGFPYIFGERKSRTRWWITYPRESECFIHKL